MGKALTSMVPSHIPARRKYKGQQQMKASLFSDKATSHFALRHTHIIGPEMSLGISEHKSEYVLYPTGPNHSEGSCGTNTRQFPFQDLQGVKSQLIWNQIG